jgi:hypothetical protein
MNFNIYIEEQLGIKIEYIANISGKKRNNIIREALAEWVNHHYPADWPDSVKQFSGEANFPAFESFRNNLVSPKENIF